MGDSPDQLTVTNPFTGEVLGSVALASVGDVARAVAVGAGSPAPSDLRPSARRILERAAGLVAARHDQLARTIAAEAGKPLKQAQVEATRCVDTLTFAAVEARTLAGRMVPIDASHSGAGKIAFTLREPVGVIAAISPFNFPLNLVAHKVAPAIAAGCPVVLKPSEETPLSAARPRGDPARSRPSGGRASGAQRPRRGHRRRAGGPPGHRDDLVHRQRRGGLAAGSQPPAHPCRPGARQLHAGHRRPPTPTWTRPQPASPRPGSPMPASRACRCRGSSSKPSVHDRLLQALVARVESLVVGDPLDPATDVGPLITTAARDRVVDWIGRGHGRRRPYRNRR